MKWEANKQTIATNLTPRLYTGQFIETIFNARDQKYRDEGWTLKSGIWSPYYVNLRPIGDAPRLAADIGSGLGLVLENEMPEVNRIVGVEMAGIPIATATSIAMLERKGTEIPFAYTRPLSKKVRNLAEAVECINQMKADGVLKQYGSKNLIEGRMKEGDRIAVWDDMATNAGSKFIGRFIVYSEAERLGFKNVECSHAAYLLDRGQGAFEEGLRHDQSEVDPHPGKVHMHSIIQFESGIRTLESEMKANEYGLVRSYMKDPQKYQDPDAIKYVLKHRKALG